uniref:Uncharacterized protein n=1 Tax=viral metagenome TaxID=1070528 RepID=A0A6M3MHP8_9ZZZZ
MADEMNTDERAKFESMMRKETFDDLKRLSDGDYASYEARVGWIAWQARAALSPNAEDMATASAQGFRDGVASLSAAEPAPEIFMMPETWHVIAHVQGEPILSIGYDWVSGKGELTEAETQAVIGMAQHLLSFVGYGLPPSSFDPDEAEPAPALTQGAAIAAGAVYATFEEWAKEEGGDFALHNCGPYNREAMKLAGMAWRASHGQAPAQAAPEGWNGTYEHAWRMAAQYIMESEAKSKKIWQDAGFTWMRHPSPQAAQQAPTNGNWVAADDVQRLVRELDVALNGKEGAAVQASLCDVVAQVRSASAKAGRPLLAAQQAPSTPASFQSRVQPWLLQCFGAEIAADRVERNHRFLEESLELVQSLGCTDSEAHQLVDYVFGRPVGEPAQEVGGVMVTLAALCLANGLDMHSAGETELARIWTKVEKIRAKQAAKPKHSPLPEDVARPAPPAMDGGEDAARHSPHARRFGGCPSCGRSDCVAMSCTRGAA